MTIAFHPSQLNSTASQTPTTTSATTALNRAGQPPRFTVRVVNNSGGLIYIKFGTSSVTAANTDTPVLSGAAANFTVTDGDTHCAVILDTGTATGKVFLTSGQGGV